MFDSVPRASGAEEQAAEAAETEVMSLDAGSRASWLDAAGRQSGAVSVDTGREAQQRADSIDARAFTLGGRIYLGAEYKRGTPEGDGLLAHELTHARQQQAGPPRLAAAPKRPTAKQIKQFCAAAWIKCGKASNEKPQRIVGVRRDDKQAPTISGPGLSAGKARVWVEVPEKFSSKNLYVKVYLVKSDGTPIRGGKGIIWAGSKEKEQDVEVDRRAAEAVGADTLAFIVDEEVDYFAKTTVSGKSFPVIEVAKVGKSVSVRLDVGDAEGASGTFYAKVTFGEGTNPLVYKALHTGGGSSYRDFVLEDEQAYYRIGNLQDDVKKGKAFGIPLEKWPGK
ncbi:MAG: DUF4157 domain-containing protein [Candidatus Manganitrophus sp. SA1]|nr:DUF4157 domain-containing protein [Candidatus Manganitrophus morganii]